MNNEIIGVKRLDHITCLDGIRACAALMVMVFHFVGHGGEPIWLLKIAKIGQTGVDLFFVLSGFLITRILLESRGASNYYSAFYARRSLRIMPLYYGFILLNWAVRPLLLQYDRPDFSSQSWVLLYLENFYHTYYGHASLGPGHFWSLAVEEHFYLGWPFLIGSFSGRSLRWAIALVLFIPMCLRYALMAEGFEVYFFTLTRIDSIGWGALLALIANSGMLYGYWSKLIIRSLLVVLPVLLIPMFIIMGGSGSDWLQVFKLSLIPLFYSVFIAFVMVDGWGAVLRGVFEVRIMCWLGGISYGIYVYHVLIFEGVRFLFGDWPYLIKVIMSFSATILIAYVSYRFFESPILGLKKFFKYRIV